MNYSCLNKGYRVLAFVDGENQLVINEAPSSEFANGRGTLIGLPAHLNVNISIYFYILAMIGVALLMTDY